MGHWEKCKVPPAEAKKDKGAPKLALKLHLSAMKVVYERRQHREGVVVFDYPSEAELMKQKVIWQDFKSVLALVHNIFKREKEDAEKA
jgi:hypothetical protein